MEYDIAMSKYHGPFIKTMIITNKLRHNHDDSPGSTEEFLRRRFWHFGGCLLGIPLIAQENFEKRHSSTTSSSIMIIINQQLYSIARSQRLVAIQPLTFKGFLRSLEIEPMFHQPGGTTTINNRYLLSSGFRHQWCFWIRDDPGWERDSKVINH